MFIENGSEITILCDEDELDGLSASSMMDFSIRREVDFKFFVKYTYEMQIGFVSRLEVLFASCV
jgi:hypothetical protein